MSSPLMNVDQCYEMHYYFKTIRFKVKKFEPNSNKYVLKLCNNEGEIVMYGLTTKQIESLVQVDCDDC